MTALNDIIPHGHVARWVRLGVVTALLTLGALCQLALASFLLVCTPSLCAAGSPGYGCVDGERICGQQAVWVCEGQAWHPVRRCAARGAVCLEPIPGQARCEAAPCSIAPQPERHAPSCAMPPPPLCTDAADHSEEDAWP